MTRASLLLLFAWVIALSASPAAADDAVQSGREALGRTGGSWYDDDGDKLRPVAVERSADEAPASDFSPAAEAAGGAVQIFIWIALAGVLGIVLFVMIRAFLDREWHSAAAATTAPALGDAARIEALPFRLERGGDDLLAEARRCYEAGRYGEAIVYLFSYQLVALDRRHVVHLHRGKTNRQYLREIGRRGPVRSLVERTMIAFEDVFFGKHPLDRARFEACWNEMGEFERTLETTGAQPAGASS